MPTCPDCSAVVSDTARFCDNCGYPLHTSEPAAPPAADFWSPAAPSIPAAAPPSNLQGKCSACGFQNLPGEMFCQNCGVQLPPVASTPPPPPRPVTGPRISDPPPAPDRCVECGSPVAPRDVFCLNCGVLIHRTAAPPPEQPPRPPSQPVPEPYSPTAPDIEPLPSAPPFVEPHRAEPPAPALESTLPDEPAAFPPVEAGPPPVSIPPAAPPVAAGTLIVRATGAELPLPPGKGEIVIGRSDPVRDIYPEIDLTPHGGDNQGVSRRHARIVIKPDGVSVEDLNSTNYTFLNRQRLQPGQLYPISDGDEIRVGLLILDYRRT